MTCVDGVERTDVIKGFNIGHSDYIETASGTKHMYFLLGTDATIIEKGIRCKDYLQEVFLSKRYKRINTRSKIYGYPMHKVKKATKLFLTYPHRDMLKYKDNIKRCITYINSAYNINIKVTIYSSYIELHMGKSWFTDKINNVEGSVITTLIS